MDWSHYFAMMADWKRLPAYKAEPRIDSLVGFYLPDALAEFLGEPMVAIIPELPIRLATVKPQHEGTTFADRSYKVDFYLLGASGTHYLVEFKTDSASRREQQDAYLAEAQAVGMAALLAGIVRIASVSTYKRKYRHLLDKLTLAGLLDAETQPAAATDRLEVIFVQPQPASGSERVVDFAMLAAWLERTHHSEPFALALASALHAWSRD